MRVFVYIHYLEIGGAERALIGLLNALVTKDVDVDLFLNQHTGEFLELIPKDVNLLPELSEYSAIERPISQIVKEGHIGIALRRIWSKLQHSHYLKRAKPEGVDESIFQYVMRAVSGGLRDLSYLGDYDLAISFLHPHNIVLNKVKAKKRICWIHTDYSTIHVDRKMELPIWNGFDAIAAISDEAGKAFASKFPEVKDKIITIENILSPDSIRKQADLGDISAEMPNIPGEVKILSIGRFCTAKRFDEVPRICRILLDKGLKFKWYIVGFGDVAETRANIDKYGIGNTLVLLGKKANPYPYIKACDVYAQPSLYEGKSVTVREAQILCKPVVISNYPTAKSQIIDGVDGKIVPLNIDSCAQGIAEFIKDINLRANISEYLKEHDYGNEDEVNKVLSYICN